MIWTLNYPRHQDSSTWFLLEPAVMNFLAFWYKPSNHLVFHAFLRLTSTYTVCRDVKRDIRCLAPVEKPSHFTAKLQMKSLQTSHPAPLLSRPTPSCLDLRMLATYWIRIDHRDNRLHVAPEPTKRDNAVTSELPCERLLLRAASMPG